MQITKQRKNREETDYVLSYVIFLIKIEFFCQTYKFFHSYARRFINSAQKNNICSHLLLSRLFVIIGTLSQFEGSFYGFKLKFTYLLFLFIYFQSLLSLNPRVQTKCSVLSTVESQKNKKLWKRNGDKSEAVSD